MVKRFALGWVLSSVPLDDDPQAWIMVRNSQRGWELPGGWVEDGEPVSYTHLTLPTSG